MLHYTSLLFISNAIHGGLVCNYMVEYLLMCLVGTSLIHHSKYYELYIGKKIIHTADICLVYTAFCMSFYNIIEIYQVIGLVFSVYLNILTLSISAAIGITTAYYEHKLTLYNVNWRYLHAFFHIFGCLGGHLLLYNYSQAFPYKCYEICKDIRI